MNDPAADNVVDNAVAEGGAYELIRKRLIEQGKRLSHATNELNESRLQEFGSADMSVSARIRVRTENNCIPRDIVQVGDVLLFGFNVFIGLKKETKVHDVFSLFSLKENGNEYDIEEIPLKGSFLADASFVNDFDELYRYYKHTRLTELTVNNGRLLAGFQIGERPEDIRVFRWSVSADGKTIKYIDNRGERDIALPPKFDFEWLDADRDLIVHGRHAHFNIEDTLFVDNLGGTLTFKIENNTLDGLGIYSEQVSEKTQSLDDLQLRYAKVGGLILVEVLPYREEQWRYFIYNTFNESILRVDNIGLSCIQLPEDHGVIFPGGYYLQTGEYKTYDGDGSAYRFKRSLLSPNGEDVLYVFYEPIEGLVALLPYNLINKQLDNPIYCHGYALGEDGVLVVFTATEEAARVHPMQIWQTPFNSPENAATQSASTTALGRIGNSELVRGISDLFSVCRLIESQTVSSAMYQELSAASQKLFDQHYWLDGENLEKIAHVVREITETAELVLDEFEKVKSIRQQSAQQMNQAVEKHEALLRKVRTLSGDLAEEYVATLNDLDRQRGHLTTLKDLRYIDLEKLAKLDSELAKESEALGNRTVEFLSQDDAFQEYERLIDGLGEKISAAPTMVDLEPHLDRLESITSGLDLLSEMMTRLAVADATIRTKIVDAISFVYARANQVKAAARHRSKDLTQKESIAQFGAQFKLFSQSVTNALNIASSPEKCDEQLSRLIVQLEELESQFSDHDEFLNDILEKREEIYEAFESRKQQLLDERQRKAQSLSDAANRILKSIEKRAMGFKEKDDLNTFFASDPLIQKVKEIVTRLREFDEAIKADNLEAALKSARDQALRVLRDKTEIFEEGGNIIKLGPVHRFSVNTQALDLTIIPREDTLFLHLTGTDYYEPIDHPRLLALKPYWNVSLDSESPTVYRSEYLAAQIMEAAENGRDDLTTDVLQQALLDEKLLQSIVRAYAEPRYKEGYEKGIHDHDAAIILSKILPALESADLLRYDPLCRGLAQVFWANRLKKSRNTPKGQTLNHDTWTARAQSAVQMRNVFASNEATQLLVAEVNTALAQFIEENPIPVKKLDIWNASNYLVAELSRDRTEFICSKYAIDLVATLKWEMNDATWRHYQRALEEMLGWPAERWKLTSAWLKALVTRKNLSNYERFIPEAIALINSDERLERRQTEADLSIVCENLMGDHATIKERKLQFTLDDYLYRLERHRFEYVPEFHEYLDERHKVIHTERERLKIESFKARPLSSFVRNRLINEAYLPVIGDNLAKQMGSIGENRRTDQMGLLMMISPPGYGKTTLMEYVASRLGLVFMKINCPALGHDVKSLDPAQAPNATAKQELEKLNLSFEMGSNVMLYLDDIQHTHPEFLQKFISLCDGTRRIEGVWQQNTKTYDMRGKKFCVVMAGNPYTESGEVFKIPDMLANRADIYNLGDILSGMDEQFAMSYIENSLTSNPVLAPLALRDMNDLYKLMRIAKGENIATTDLSHQYSGAEVNEIVQVLNKLFTIQELVLKVNQQYIASAAQNDKYRVEPPFKLQGSYRNMNKLAEKVNAVMNEKELIQLIDDHYLGEAQLLTTGTEDNLLKLSELRGILTEEKAQRWAQIKEDFLRNKAMGGDDADTGRQVVTQLLDLSKGLDKLGNTANELVLRQKAIENDAGKSQKIEFTDQSLKTFASMIEATREKVEVINQPVPGIDKLLRALVLTMEKSIFPLIRTMDKKLEIDLANHREMQEVSTQLRELEASFKALNSTRNKKRNDGHE